MFYSHKRQYSTSSNAFAFSYPNDVGSEIQGGRDDPPYWGEHGYFARLMQTFEQHGVAFVSVTQQLNSASSQMHFLVMEGNGLPRAGNPRRRAK